MITRKAAIGFIILALIVFPTAYSSWSAPLKENPSAKIELSGLKHMDNSVRSDVVYRPPMVTFNSAFDMATAATIIIELFTLICYLILKRIEPVILAWEKAERDRISKG